MSLASVCRKTGANLAMLTIFVAMCRAGTYSVSYIYISPWVAAGVPQKVSATVSGVGGLISAQGPV